MADMTDYEKQFLVRKYLLVNSLDVGDYMTFYKGKPKIYKKPIHNYFSIHPEKGYQQSNRFAVISTIIAVLILVVCIILYIYIDDIVGPVGPSRDNVEIAKRPTLQFGLIISMIFSSIWILYFGITKILRLMDNYDGYETRQISQKDIDYIILTLRDMYDRDVAQSLKQQQLQDDIQQKSLARVHDRA